MQVLISAARSAAALFTQSGSETVSYTHLDVYKRQDDARIGLRHCPFLEVARAHPEVVCPLHLGLMQGAMQAWAAPVSVATLTPFAQPDLCVAELTGVGR